MPNSFWGKHMAAHFDSNGTSAADVLVNEVISLYSAWKKMFRMHSELPLNVSRPYSFGRAGFITASSGLSQIRDYIELEQDEKLSQHNARVVTAVKRAKLEFYDLLVGKSQLNYFGSQVRGALISARPANGRLNAQNDNGTLKPRQRAKRA